jgi:hypothetical protein
MRGERDLAFLTSAFSLSTSPHEIKQSMSAIEVFLISIMQHNFYKSSFSFWKIANIPLKSLHVANTTFEVY